MNSTTKSIWFEYQVQIMIKFDLMSRILIFERWYGLRFTAKSSAEKKSIDLKYSVHFSKLVVFVCFVKKNKVIQKEIIFSK